MHRPLVALLLLASLLLAACQPTSGDTGAVDTAVARVLATATAAAREYQTAEAGRTKPLPLGQSPGAFGDPTMNDLLAVSVHQLTRTFEMDGSGAPEVWRISIQFASGQDQRLLRTEAVGSVPAGVTLGMYRVTQGQPMPSADSASQLLPSTYVYKGDVLYIRAVNSQSTPQKTTVRLTEDPELRIEPSSARLAAGGSQAFRATQGGTSYSPALAWSVEEGAAGGSVTSAGVYTAPQQAGTYRVVAATTDYPKVYRVSASVTVGGSTPTITRTPPPVTATPTRTPGPTAKPRSGAWVLKSTFPESRGETTIVGTSAKSNMTVFGVSFPATHSWSGEPPARLSPGQVLKVTVSVTMSVAGDPQAVRLFVGATTGMRIDFDPGGGPVCCDSVSVAGPPYSGSMTASKDNSYTVVAGSKGQKMDIQYTAYRGSGNSAEIHHIYEWDPDAA